VVHPVYITRYERLAVADFSCSGELWRRRAA